MRWRKVFRDVRRNRSIRSRIGLRASLLGESSIDVNECISSFRDIFDSSFEPNVPLKF